MSNEVKKNEELIEKLVSVKRHSKIRHKNAFRKPQGLLQIANTPLSSRAENIISCISYLNHCPLPKVLKVFSVVLAIYAHIVTIEAPH